MGQIREAVLRLQLIDGVTGPAGGIRGALDRLDSKISGFDRAIGQTRGQLLNATGVALAAGAALAVPVRRAMELEDAMADIAKVSDFQGEGLIKLRNDIVALSREVPMAAAEIAALAAELAASGTADSELLEMTRLVAMAGTAYGITGDEAGESLGKIRTALGMTIDETKTFADQVNALSDATASSAPDLLDFSRRVGSLGKQYGFATDEVLAFGSAMVAAGATPEQAATGFQAVGRALVRGTAATKAQREAYKRLGLESKAVAKSMADDAMTTTQDVFARIRALPEWEQASVMNQLFGDEARVAMPLVSNTNLLAESLSVLADKAGISGSVLREFQTRIGTATGKLSVLGNKVVAAGLSLGNTMLPSVSAAADALGPLADGVGRFVIANEGAVKTAILATGALMGLRVALLAGKLGYLLLGRQALIATRGVLAASLAIGNAGVAAARFSAAGVIAGFGAARRAVVGFAGAASVLGVRGAVGVALSGVGKTVLGLLNPLRLLRGAAVVARGALMFSGVGLAIAGVAAAAMWVWNNLEGLGEFARGVGSGFMSAFQPVAPLFEPIATGLGRVSGWVSSLLGPVGASATEWRGWGVAVGEAVGGVVATVAGLPGRIAGAAAGIYAAGVGLTGSAWRGIKDGLAAGMAWMQAQGEAFGTTLEGWRDRAAVALKKIPGAVTALAGNMLAAGGQIAQALADGVKAKVGELINWFKGLPARIIAAIGSIDLSGLIKWPSMPAWLGGGSTGSGSSIRERAAANNAGGDGFPTIDGKRERGGPVSAGQLYLVGERGPELFSPGRDGEIISNDKVPAPLGDAAPSRRPAAGYGMMQQHREAGADGEYSRTSTSSQSRDRQESVGVVHAGTTVHAPISLTVNVKGGDKPADIAKLVEDAARRAVMQALSALDRQLQRSTDITFGNLQFGDS